MTQTQRKVWPISSFCCVGKNVFEIPRGHHGRCKPAQSLLQSKQQLWMMNHYGTDFCGCWSHWRSGHWQGKVSMQYHLYLDIVARNEGWLIKRGCVKKRDCCITHMTLPGLRSTSYIFNLSKPDVLMPFCHRMDLLKIGPLKHSFITIWIYIGQIFISATTALSIDSSFNLQSDHAYLHPSIRFPRDLVAFLLERICTTDFVTTYPEPHCPNPVFSLINKCTLL